MNENQKEMWQAPLCEEIEINDKTMFGPGYYWDGSSYTNS